MSSIDIRINIKELLEYNESLRSEIGDRVLIKIIKEFSDYVLRLYFFSIREATYSNRYKGKWEPKDEEGYIEYLGVTPVGDILEYIEEALESKRIGYKFIIRINPHYKYPKSKLFLSKVVRAIDAGTTKFNSRPILRKIIRQIENNMIDLWRGFLTMKGVV